jgi:hypothetical protein
MSPRQIPIDEFQQLDRQAVACALRLIELEVAGTLHLVATDEAARQDEALLDELTSVLTLRKVFRLRLAELVGEEPGPVDAPSHLVRERYVVLTPQPVLA